MIKNKIRKLTGDYRAELIHSLRNKKRAMIYLQVALDEYQQDNNVAALLLALRNVADAQGGITELARKTKLNRESLYKTLSGKGNPTLLTLGLVLKALGFHLAVKSA